MKTFKIYFVYFENYVFHNVYHEIINTDFVYLLCTSKHRGASVGRPAKTYISCMQTLDVVVVVVGGGGC